MDGKSQRLGNLKLGGGEGEWVGVEGCGRRGSGRGRGRGKREKVEWGKEWKRSREGGREGGEVGTKGYDGERDE